VYTRSYGQIKMMIIIVLACFSGFWQKAKYKCDQVRDLRFKYLKLAKYLFKVKNHPHLAVSNIYRNFWYVVSYVNFVSSNYGSRV